MPGEPGRRCGGPGAVAGVRACAGRGGAGRAAARLAGMLDPAFLAEAGWDPAIRVLSLPASHPLLGRTLCRADGCPATAQGTKTGGLCQGCFARLQRAGMSAEQIAAVPRVPRRRRARRVPGPGVRADVAGRPAGAADRAVRAAFAAVPPYRGDNDGAVPGRPAVRPLPRWARAVWRRVPGGPKAGAGTVPPMTCGGASPSPPPRRPASGTGS